MSSSAIALISLSCVFGGALIGLFLRRLLPDHHLKDDSLNIVKLATGLIATMSALVLGLLISSAKGSFDRINNEIVETAARVVALDRVLADYGPQTAELRAMVKRNYSAKVDAMLSGDAVQLAKLASPESARDIEHLHALLWKLAPRDDEQRGLRERALSITTEIASTRTLILLQKDGTIPMPLLVALVSWLAIIFAAFGLCAPRNHTTVAALFVGALCASAAIFLILELDRPLEGIIRISSAPLHAAVANLGQ